MWLGSLMSALDRKAGVGGWGPEAASWGRRKISVGISEGAERADPFI